MKGLSEDDLPGFWRDADRASLAGQKWSVQYFRAKLIGAVVATVGGAMSWMLGKVDVGAVVITLGFFLALSSEVAAWLHESDKKWYSGRAFAESTKTLAWRYAVAAEPFPKTMGDSEARALLRQRFDEVSAEAREGIVLHSENPVVTPAMTELRSAPFEDRRAAYLEGRTEEQQKWYAGKAKSKAKAVTAWRVTLVVSETVALLLAALRITGGWSIDFAGIFGALVAAGAAWTAMRQHAPLASAYSIAASELALQADRIRELTEKDWATAVADAEEAISREHTLWLASRTGKKPINIVKSQAK